MRKTSRKQGNSYIKIIKNVKHAHEKEKEVKHRLHFNEVVYLLCLRPFHLRLSLLEYNRHCFLIIHPESSLSVLFGSSPKIHG